MKVFAESSPRGEGIDVSAAVSALFVQLHTHEQAAESEARQVRRIARRIERLIKTLPHGLSPAMGNSDHHPHDGGPHSECERRDHRAIERSQLARFAKLL